MATLNIWDIDDTLFKTEARVSIVKNDVHIRYLNPGEYTEYTKDVDESFDFSEFRSAKIFRSTAKPIAEILDTATKIVHDQSNDSKTILLTARADLDDKYEFIQTFRDHGFPIDSVFVERAGNVNASKAAIAKAFIIRKYIRSGKYDTIRMWDDSRHNLDVFMKLSTFHPSIQLISYIIDKGGAMSQYKTTKSNVIDTSGIEIPHSGMTFGRHMMPQIQSDLVPKFLKELEHKGIDHRSTKMSVSKLKATQSEFNLEKVEAMMHKPSKSDKPIIISNDNYILDGHHRWLAEYNRDKNYMINVYIIDLPILDLLRSAKEFSGVKFKKVTESVMEVVHDSLRKRNYK